MSDITENPGPSQAQELLTAWEGVIEFSLTTSSLTTNEKLTTALQIGGKPIALYSSSNT